MSSGSGAGLSRWWGPVFDAERVTRARRWQGYALRSLVVLGLLGALTLVWASQTQRGDRVTVQQLASLGSTAYMTLTSLELLAVLLIAPAATAGTICLDRSRGMLAHVFVTDLSNHEIVLGKLAARLLPVWGLVACALPVAAVATWLGGIDPVALTGSFLIIAGVAFLGCAFALLLSVWANKPHEVISVVFGVWFAWILACPAYQICSMTRRVPWWLEWSNPLYLLYTTHENPGRTNLLEPILFALACGVLGSIATAVAIAKVRVVGCRSARVQARRLGPIRRAVAALRRQVRWGQGPKLDANPVLWREWHRNRPSRWSRFVWVGFEASSVLVGIGLLIAGLCGSLVLWDEEIFAGLIGLYATLGLLLVSTATASVLTDERSRGSLDVLMSTPVSTRTILWAKWRGAFRRVPHLAVWPIVLGIGCALITRPTLVQMAIIYLIPALILAQGAALVSLGLALATWFKRPGQATAWSVGLLIATAVGWPLVGEFVPLATQEQTIILGSQVTGVALPAGAAVTTSPNGTTVVMMPNGATVMPQYVMTETLQSVTLDWLLSLGSPFYNVALPLITAMDESVTSNDDVEAIAFLILVVGWMVSYGLLAWGLFEATVRTFDRCLGRTPERLARPGFTGWGWKTPGAAGQPAGRVASCVPPPR